MADESSYSSFKFEDSISVEIPKNWTLLDDKTKKVIGDFGDKAMRETNAAPILDNNVLVIANAPHGSKVVPPASIRLSVRYGSQNTQSEMQLLAVSPQDEQRELMAELLSKTIKSLVHLGIAKNPLGVEARIDVNENLSCTFTEVEYPSFGIMKVHQNWICPMGTKVLKLSSSFHKDKDKDYRLIINHIWQSLKA